MRKLVLVIISFLFVLPGYTQQYKFDDFVETNPPKYLSKEWSELNFSKSFKVSIVEGVLKINDDDKLHGRVLLNIEGGELIGLNHGEWGGALLYKGKAGTIDTIKKGNIVGILNFQNQIYFIEGLAHGSFNSGALYKLIKKRNKFIYDKVLNLEDAPQVSLVLKDKLLIASFSNFYVFKNGKIETVFKKMFWDSLYPNSIAVLNNETYIGIRGGFVKLNIPDKTIKFYRYNHITQK
ncbi:hypothetical protein [Mucilaginibacter segetis]|uniref:Uncharacterized protein n=1 Tax=Mucilaginibacter segetis TaxID=2793071 RepID=A0A934PWH5_9SPHI|nr:hypothetical protein [Mucilaginibacter segetis]MBK0380366.1 hypothetical protein [Mucilaginibacter segetis]